MIGLEYIRKLFGDTGAELAEKLNVSKVNISYWENGKKPIPKSRIEEIAKIYNVPAYLINKDLTELEKLKLQWHKTNIDLQSTEHEEPVFELDVNGDPVEIGQITAYDKGQEEYLRSLETDIKEEKLILSIRKFINSFTADDNDNIGLIDIIGQKEANIRLFKVFLSLCKSKKTDEIFLMSVLRAVEKSEDLTDEWGESNPMETTPSFVDKLCKVMRDQRIEQQKREEQETKEFIDLFGSPDDNDSEE